MSAVMATEKTPALEYRPLSDRDLTMIVGVLIAAIGSIRTTRAEERLGAGLEQLVAQGIRKGIFMFNHGASPITGATQNVVLDQHFTKAALGTKADLLIPLFSLVIISHSRHRLRKRHRLNRSLLPRIFPRRR
jgi:hypothetical protein